jgi:S-DNA-T family DNA segregation ATPase FtsK/SpoIIIE
LGPILKKGFDSPLGEILTKGRKFGFIVWGCSQLSQKDVIGDVRDLFPQRICLAVPSADLTDAVLGAGAESDGARCSQIPTDTPGVGYMFKNGVRGFIKFRSMYLDDAAIAKLVGVVEAPQTMPMPDSEFKPQVEW